MVVAAALLRASHDGVITKLLRQLQRTTSTCAFLARRRVDVGGGSRAKRVCGELSRANGQWRCPAETDGHGEMTKPRRRLLMPGCSRFRTPNTARANRVLHRMASCRRSRSLKGFAGVSMVAEQQVRAR